MAGGIQFVHEKRGGADMQETLEDVANQGGLFPVDHQLALDHVITERWMAPHPHAFLSRCRDLVADALAGHLTLELGEGEQDVEGEAAHGGGGVELLGDADEGDGVAVEDLDQLGEVHQRPAQPIDLVDHHHVDMPGLDVGEQPLKGGTLQCAAGDAAVVIHIGKRDPAFLFLADNIGLAGLALGVEGVELHLQPFLRGFARVDGTADLAGWLPGHHVVFPCLRRPKKSQPFQRVPVMARATAERLLYFRPCHSKPPSITVT